MASLRISAFVLNQTNGGNPLDAYASRKSVIAKMIHGSEPIFMFADGSPIAKVDYRVRYAGTDQGYIGSYRGRNKASELKTAPDARS